jgi:hypothetical protein
MANTYSFLDVQCTLSGPGGNIPLGNEAGVAEEGITIEQVDSVGRMVIGADGTPMQVLQATRGAHITVRLLKTSPTNALLMQMVNFQRTSGNLWGQNTLSLNELATGDNIDCAFVAFDKVPKIDYDKAGKMIDWTFLAGTSDFTLGINV